MAGRRKAATGSRCISTRNAPHFWGSFGNLEAKLCIFGRFCASFSAGMGRRRRFARRGELGSFRFSWLLAGVDAPVSGASTNSILQAGHKGFGAAVAATRSEEHTSELQSLRHLVCRLLLEKKK